MGQDNTVPRRINRVEGVLGQLIQSQGPGVVEKWTNPSDIGVDYGLSFIGTVTGIVAAPKFQCLGLIGFGDDFFEDYWAYVVWDAGGAGADPQGQMLECTGYDSATGDFTVAAFAPNVIAVGDKVLLIHPTIAEVLATLGTHDTDIKALLATIAGYIDTEVAGIKTQTDKIAGKMLFRMVKWSANKVQVQIDAAGATIVMPTITIDNLPADATVVEAHLMFKYRMIENKYAGVNNLNGATVATTSQVFQIQDDGGGAWADGINYVDNYHTLADSAREGGDVDVGEPNVGVANVVDGNDIYNVRLLLGKADFDFINFDDCQVGLDIWYSV